MKFRAYAFFYLLFGVLPDIVICLATGWPLWGKILPFVPTLLAGVYLWRVFRGIQYTESLRVFSYLTFIFEFPKFIFILLLALSPVVAAVAGIGVSLFFSVMIFHVTTHLKTIETVLPFRRLPRAFEGLRICQLSDFHLGSFGKANPYIKRIVDAVLAEKPDLILFTGDLVNFDSHEADGYLEELKRLSAPLGVWAIRGNHDYLLHGHHNETERIADTERLLELERSLGWKLLLNEHALLEKDGEKIALAGVENISSNAYFRQMGGDLKKAMEGLPEGIFTILLSHDPTHWDAEVVPETDIDLTLSGHTHGLKYKLAGLNPKTWKFPHPAGVYTHGEQTLHVSPGLGSAFAFRLGGYPHVDLLKLTIP